MESKFQLLWPSYWANRIYIWNERYGKKIYVACIRWNKTWRRFWKRNKHSYVHHITVCFIEKCRRNSFWIERSALQTKIEKILNLRIWIENRAVAYIVLSCLLLLLFIPLICAPNNIVYRWWTLFCENCSYLTF